jgi:hypothetical protein
MFDPWEDHKMAEAAAHAEALDRLRAERDALQRLLKIVRGPGPELKLPVAATAQGVTA